MNNSGKLIVDKAFKENRISQQAFYEACNSIISSLQEELRDNEIDSVERTRIEDNMIKVAAMIGEKDSENKGMILKILSGAALFFGGIITICANILGSNSRLSHRGNQVDDSDEDEDDNIIDV